MALCEKCGTQVENGVNFCTVCGAPMAEIRQPSQQPQGAQQPQESEQNDFSAKIAELNNTADSTAEFDRKDITDNKVMALLAYFGPLVLVPILAAKESKFARYHANQGLILFLTEIAYSIIYGILSNIIIAISWRLYFIVNIISIVGIVFAVLAVLGIINAAQGKAKELPVIGKFKILK